VSDARFQSSPFEASALAEAVRLARPFASLSEAARLEQLRLSGMHGPAFDHRIGCEAFEVRADLTVGDACETVDQLLKQVHGTLDLLVTSGNLQPGQAESCAACAVLAKQASGALAVVKAAVFPGNLR